MNQWKSASPIDFNQVSTGGDIRISWQVGDHGDGSPFDGPSNVLAHAFYPTHGGLHFDDDETWTDNNPPSGVDLVSVAIHELGHSLGLGHSSDTNAVMYAYYTGIRRNLNPDDIAGIQAIYGVRGWASLGGAIASNISVGSNSDGRLQVFARSTSNSVFHNSQTTPGGTWSGWASLGGGTAGDPSVGRNSDGRLQVFARGTNNAGWTTSQTTPGGIWSGWASLGGAIASNISVGSNSDGRLQVFARSTSNTVIHNSQTTPGGTWSGWASLGGAIASNISVGSNSDGRLQVFARST